MRGLILTLILLSCRAAEACVGCRQPGVSALEEPQTLTAGVALSWSVVSLLVLVVLVVGFLTAYIARTCARVDREKNPS